MATSIFFNGRLISVPGSYSEVDASGLEAVGLGAAGIVAIIGEGEGGKPVSAIDEVKDLIRFSKPEAGRAIFRSGPLRESLGLAFQPSTDPAIPGGAAEVVAMKVNPATQSSATLANTNGDSLVLTSLDYGLFTTQINVTLQTGTTQGKLLTVVFEDITETEDNLGGDAAFTLEYDGGATGWDTVTTLVQAGGSIVSTGVRDTGGADTAITTQLAANGVIEILSDNVADVGQVVTAYGLDGSGDPVTEDLTLNGTTVVIGTQTFSKVYGVSIDQTTATLGVTTLRASPGGAVIFDVPAGIENEGADLVQYGYVANTTVQVVSDGASTKEIIIFGKNTSGATVGEKLTLTGTTPVNTTGSFSEVTRIVVGDVEAAQTLTTTVVAASASALTQTTLQKAADYYNARSVELNPTTTRGFIFTLAFQGAYPVSKLDVTPAAVTISAAPASFYADLYTIIDWINQNSQLVSAAAASGASGGAPDNLTNPVFLTGGVEGTTTFADYTKAFTLLKQTRVNTIVPLTGDPAVHAALKEHCAFMGGVGRSERDGIVGIQNTGLTDVPNKTEAKAAAVALNTRHVRACVQAIEKFNTAGERVEFQPMYTAVLAAGMQAGSSVGTSLTFKYADALDFRQSNTWNPIDDAEEMIQAGLLFLENVEGVGRRWVRNVTTFLQNDNLAFTEASVNEAVNFAAFNFRTNLETAVGRKGFAGTLNATKAVAIGTLGLLVDEEILVDWRALDFELIVDVMEVSVEIAPVIPINFVKSTLHLVTVRQAA